MPKKSKQTLAKLPKSILNYFAAFTETKFNFRTLINYKWTNNELTLDLALFQDFQDTLLERIRSGDGKPLTVSNNEHVLILCGNDVLSELEKALSGNFDLSYLRSCVEGEFKKITDRDERFIFTAEGIRPADNADLSENELKKQEERAFRDGCRRYNLALRKQIENILVALQEEKVEQIKEELGIEHVPPSTFNSANYLKRHFDTLQGIVRDNKGEKEYFDSVFKHFRENVEDIVLYDLFNNIQRYARYNTAGTAYLFFHELRGKTRNNSIEAYPIFFTEVNIVPGNNEVVISFPRDFVFINVPAVNYFKFPSVLTISRSSTLRDVSDNLSAMEVFLQTQYGYNKPFVLESCFKPIAAPEDMYPDIKCRIGFQVIQNENKKLLDYSEIITRLESGGKSKFVDFISDYIDGNVENTQIEVDKEYKERYPIKSPGRYISDNPLNLNDSQKRIILALHNPKNKIIVVDGPPGTGKSHAIAALTYWANQENKSVVITSHKRQALDVIDRMLTERFQGLHPKAKPSIIRMSKNGKNINSLENSLQNAVINAAGDRANNYNEQATEKDTKRSERNVVERVEKQLSAADEYQKNIINLFEFEQIERELLSSQALSEDLPSLPKIARSVSIDFEKINAFTQETIAQHLRNISLSEFGFLLKRRKDMQDFINACEEINRHTKETVAFEPGISEIPKTFFNLIEKSEKIFKKNIPISSLQSADIPLAFLKKLLGKLPDKKALEEIISSLKSLKHKRVIEEIGRLREITPGELTLDMISSGVNELQSAIALKKHKDILKEYIEVCKNKEQSISELYRKLSSVKEPLDQMGMEHFNAIEPLFHYYGSLLQKLGISAESLDTLAHLNHLTESEAKIWKWIRLHYELSGKAVSDTLTKEDLDDFYASKQKIIEHQNDVHLTNLNNFLGDIAKIKVSFDGGKRLTSKQARILLENVSGLIAEPAMISAYLPMEENLIDLLVIDEASQVSIAESISLILRAKQVVVFGDEYQYGAVGAINVSSRYSAGYFREIIDSYTDDYNVSAAERDRDALIKEVSRDIKEDEQEVEIISHPQDGAGAILWLKTFNIRTSTLSFAKAIANYTTSLREHYRSFPEIIDYSNEFFYKPVQQELIVNRIRTKPIGEVLKFIPVETRGNSGSNVNYDEIDAVMGDLGSRIKNGFKGSVGIITSFREQQSRMEQAFHERLNMPELKKNHNLAIWFVGDVQGEERDIVYYSLVEDKKYGNAMLSNIYPVIDGAADNIRSLKMQRLNVGFSRAKDTVIIVHSMPIEDYGKSRLGDALKHYDRLLKERTDNDFFVENTAVFGSPAEKDLYSLLVNTRFVKANREHIKIVPQFKIGEYIRAQYRRQIPNYRVDFLLTFSKGGKEQSLILEYDGVEYHTKNPDIVTGHNFSQEYLDYDISRQIELESYGYRFLRLNKFNLRPEEKGETRVDVLDRLLRKAFAGE